MYLLSLLCLIAACGLVDSTDDLTVTFSVTTEVRPAELGAEIAVEPGAEATTEELEVVLRPTEFRYRDGDEVVVYDFADRRVIRIDVAAKTRADDSLFAEVAFRKMEFENRRRLSDILARAGAQDNPLAITLNEHAFSLDDDQTPTEIERAQAEGQVTFRWKDKTLAFYSTETVPVKPLQAERFVRFLRYYVGGHPEILNELQSLEAIPRELSVTQYEAARERSTVLTMKSSRAGNVEPIDTTGFRPQEPPEGAGDIEKLIHRLRTDGPEKAADAAAKAARQAEDSADAGRALESVLHYLEYSLIMGRDLPEGFRARQEKLTQNEDVRRFFASISPRDRQQAEQAVETLVQLRPAAGGSAYLLGIFEANTRAGLGETDAARDLFADALAKNPSITGAWKDLGDLHLRAYDTRSAWQCWEVARAIQPNHRLLEQVTAFEQRLAEKHPEFLPAVEE